MAFRVPETETLGALTRVPLISFVRRATTRRGRSATPTLARWIAALACGELGDAEQRVMSPKNAVCMQHAVYAVLRWEDWGDCSTSCGLGQQFRTRAGGPRTGRRWREQVRGSGTAQQVDSAGQVCRALRWQAENSSCSSSCLRLLGLASWAWAAPFADCLPGHARRP